MGHEYAGDGKDAGIFDAGEALDCGHYIPEKPDEVIWHARGSFG